MYSKEKEKTKVLVVDDSSFMRKIITDILNSDPNITVIDTAENGREAIEKVKKYNPHVITLDVEMPVMNGLDSLKGILESGDGNVIMLSHVTKEGAESTIQALQNGAIDFITKPSNIFSLSGEERKKELIEKVKIAKVSKRNNKNSIVNTKVTSKNALKVSDEMKYIVAIGVSTGGPRALQDIVTVIPKDISACFLIVQHMPPGFTKTLADRLNLISEVYIKEAENGEKLEAGKVLIAPGGYHMMVEKENDKTMKIKLTKDPPIGGLRPCVDIMMNSLSKTGFKKVIGVIMTGMGSDGSIGIKSLKDNNQAIIISQDEKSCVVYGMPKVAVQTGLVDMVLPLKDITNEITKIVEVF